MVKIVNHRIESFALLGSLVLSAGLVREFVFYKQFKLSIIPFIELSELTVLVLDTLLYFAIFALLNGFIFLVLYRQFDLHESRILRLKRSGFFHWNKVVIFFFIAIGLFFIERLKERVFFNEFLMWLALLFVALYANPFIYIEILVRLKSNTIKVAKGTIWLLITAINLIVFAGLSGLNEASKIKSTNYYNGSLFKLSNGQIIRSDQMVYFVGKTKRYLFFFNLKEETSIVLPIDQVERMEFKYFDD